jgi:peptidoglycan LD-endopeptidase CwlK
MVKGKREALQGVHPLLVRVVELASRYSPYAYVVSEGVRSPKRQGELVFRGSSRTLASKHLLQPDGYGHAVDVVAVGDLDGDGDVDAQDRARTWDPVIYTGIAGAFARAAEELGIKVKWGGAFKTFFDGPHFELDIKGP